jgi:hypothetical protein
MKPDTIYCTELGGLIDRNHIVVMDSAPAVGSRVCVAPSDKVSRGLWGATGTVVRHRVDTEDPRWLGWRRAEPTYVTRVFVEFDEPRVSVGSRMTGVWLTPDLMFS